MPAHTCTLTIRCIHGTFGVSDKIAAIVVSSNKRFVILPFSDRIQVCSFNASFSTSPPPPPSVLLPVSLSPSSLPCECPVLSHPFLVACVCVSIFGSAFLILASPTMPECLTESIFVVCRAALKFTLGHRKL